MKWTAVVRFLLLVCIASCFAILTKGQIVSAQAVSCQAQGGACKDNCFFDENPVGLLDCPGTQFCCKPKGVTPPVSPIPASSGADGGTQKNTVPAQTTIGLQSLSAECLQKGNCSLDQIVQTGVNFAKFLMGLSGALFFAIFVYGGAMYLLSFGDKKRVETGRHAITGAATGIIIVMAAWTMVNYLVGAIKGTTSVGSGGVAQNACVAKGPGWSCTTLQGKNSQEALSDGSAKGLQCQTGLCPGAENILCCLPK